MAKKLFYTRGLNGSLLELVGHNGQQEKRLVIPQTGLSETHVFNLGAGGTFINLSAVPIQIEAVRDFEFQGTVIDYEEAEKQNFVFIDTEFCGILRFKSDTHQPFDSRFLYPEGEVSLYGELTLMAVKAANA